MGGLTVRDCARPKCREETDHTSGYCSDVCLRLDQDFESAPVTVLASNKAGGFGASLHRVGRTPVRIPRPHRSV